MTPIGTSAGDRMVRATTSARVRKHGTSEERKWKKDAVVGTHQEPDAVGHDQPHEAYDSCGRHSSGGQERREHVRDALDALHVGSEIARGLLTDRQEVQRPSQTDEHDHRWERVQGDHQHRTPVGAR